MAELEGSHSQFQEINDLKVKQLLSNKVIMMNRGNIKLHTLDDDDDDADYDDDAAEKG